LAMTLEELMKRVPKVPKSDVEDVIGGCVSPVGEQGGTIPRAAALKAGFPITTPGVQLDRMCGSGQQAIHFAAQAIGSGDMDCVIACGIEMMSRVPMGSSSPLNPQFNTPEQVENYRKIGGFPMPHQGQSAELICEKYNISRDDLDKFSGLSHERNAEAIKNGYFKSQTFPINVTKKDGTKSVFEKDEGVRVPVDYKKMATLPTPFKQNGKVSAANASQISDGSAALLLMSASKAQSLGLKPKARIVSCAVVGSDPRLMLDGVIPATKKALEKSKLNINQIDAFEINEAFAPVVLAWQKTMGVPFEKINIEGGAIAHGHPLGATGCILATKLVNHLQRTGKRYGLQTMCIGLGQATAMIIENPSVVAKL